MHRTVIDIDEEGAEATGAAGTIIIKGREARTPKGDYIEFTLNKPFKFYLVDDFHKMILLAGEVNTAPRFKPVVIEKDE
jgi:serine protease inhibitor